MGRVPLVRLLLAHVTGPDLRRIPDPDLVSQVFHQLHEPLAVARGLHADQHRRRQLLVKLLGVAAGMYQLPLPTIPGLCIQPTHLLPAGMEITSYNHHRRLLSSQRLCPQTKTIWVPNRAFTLIQSTFACFAKVGHPQLWLFGQRWARAAVPTFSYSLHSLRRLLPCHSLLGFGTNEGVVQGGE